MNKAQGGILILVGVVIACAVVIPIILILPTDKGELVVAKGKHKKCNVIIIECNSKLSRLNLF